MKKFHPSNQIHPTAIISDAVEMGINNRIGPYVVLEGKIVLGDNNHIGVGSFLYNNIEIGNNNIFTGSVSCGIEGEMGTKGDILLDDGKVIIGDNNKFREFVSIQSPVRRKETRIGNNCYIMSRSYIAHDVSLADFVVMAGHSMFGGGCTVERNAYIGMGAIIHQWTDIGESAMIGIHASITRHILPFSVIIGSPSRILKFNKIGAERRGINLEEVNFIDLNFRKIIHGDIEGDSEIIQKIRTFDAAHDDCLKKFYDSK